MPIQVAAAPAVVPANMESSSSCFRSMPLKRTGNAESMRKDLDIKMSSSISITTIAESVHSEATTALIDNTVAVAVAVAVPNFSRMQLKQTGKADSMRQGLDIKQDATTQETDTEHHNSNNNTLPQLKKTGHADSVRRGMDIKNNNATGTGTPATATSEDTVTDSFSASFPTRVSLKQTGKAESMRQGIDIKIDEIINTENASNTDNNNNKEQPPSFAAVQLKQTTTTGTPATATSEDTVTDSFSTSFPTRVSLKQTGKAESMRQGIDIKVDEIVKNEKTATAASEDTVTDSFSTSFPTRVSLKQTGKAESMRQGIDIKVDEIVNTDNASNTDNNKTATATSEDTVTDSFSTSFPTRVSLKQTGKAESMRQGIDIKVDENTSVNTPSSNEPSFAGVQLKQTGHADSVKKGQDIVKKPAANSNTNTDTIVSDTVSTLPSDTKEKKKDCFKSMQLKQTGNAESMRKDRNIKPDAVAVVVPDDDVADTVSDLPHDDTKEKKKDCFKSLSLKQTGKAESMRQGIDIKVDGIVNEKNPSNNEPSFAGVQLKQTGHAESVKKGQDIVKKPAAKSHNNTDTSVSDTVSDLPSDTKEKKKDCFKSLSLKQTGKAESMRQGIDIKVDENTNVNTPSSNEPSFAGLQLKQTGHAESVKNGKDIVKKPAAKSKNNNADTIISDTVSTLPSDTKEKKKDCFKSMRLKQTGNAESMRKDRNIKPDAVVVPDDVADTVTDLPHNDTKEKKKDCFKSLSLKQTGKAESMRQGLDIKVDEIVNEKHPSSTEPSFAGVQLKQTGHADSVKKGEDIKSPLLTDRALVSDATSVPTIPRMSLKQTGKADSMQKGLDIKPDEIVDENPSNNEPSFAGVQLKQTGHADSVKKGADIKSPLLRDRAIVSDVTSVSTLPRMSLKQTGKADSMRQGLDIKPDEIVDDVPTLPRISLKQTGKADSMRQGLDIKPDESVDENPSSNRPSFAGVQLKETGHADSVKKGADIKNPLLTERALISDVTKVPTKVPTLPRISLKQTGKADSMRQGLDIKPDESVDENPSSNRPSFAGVQLKETGHADSVKKGADIKSPLVTERALVSDVTKVPTLPRISLKQTGKADSMRRGLDIKPDESVDENPSSKRPSFAGVQLKETGHADSVKKGADIVRIPTEKNDAPVDPLLGERAAAAVAPASFPRVTLKQTGKADSMRKGLDIKADDSVHDDNEPAYAVVPLKETGHADSVKKDADIMKPAGGAAAAPATPGEAMTQKYSFLRERSLQVTRKSDVYLFVKKMLDYATGKETNAYKQMLSALKNNTALAKQPGEKERVALFIAEEIVHNATELLYTEEQALQFSPRIIRVSFALWLRDPSAYKELSAGSLTIFPQSMRTTPSLTILDDIYFNAEDPQKMIGFASNVEGNLTVSLRGELKKIIEMASLSEF